MAPGLSGLTLTLGLEPTSWRVIDVNGDTCTIAGSAVVPGPVEAVTVRAGPCLAITLPALAASASHGQQQFTLYPADPDILDLLRSLFEQGGLTNGPDPPNETDFKSWIWW